MASRNKKIGIILPGQSDEDILKQVKMKLKFKAKFKILQANEYQYRKINNYARLLLNIEKCSKVIILRDSHCCQNISIIEKEMKDNIKVNKRLKICVIKHAIESWLLADHNGISIYLHTKIKEIPNPENNCRPEEMLDLIFKKNGKKDGYIKTKHAKILSENMDLNLIKSKCPSFKNFLKLISDC